MFDRAALKQIADDAGEHILSLYLNVNNAVQGNQGSSPEWRVWLKNTLNDLEGGMNGEQKREWRPIREQVEAYVQDYQPSARGLVLFADGETLRDFAVPFSVENAVRYGKPMLAPLLWAIDEFEPYVIALVDNEQAHFFVAQMGSTDAQGQMKTDIDEYDFGQKTLVSRGGSGIDEGSGRDDFNRVIDEHTRNFHRDVVARIEELKTQSGADRIIVGGSEPGVSEVKNMLTPKLQESLVDVMHIPLKAGMREIMDKAQPAAEQYERQQEMELVNQVIDQAKSGGRGALGHKDVVEALSQGRVELLVIPWPNPDEKLVTRLTLEALQLNTQIEMVHGEAADRLKTEGGLGARLYYAPPVISYTT